MNELNRTAFHEAGHARIAYHINPGSVKSLRIHDDGGWKGEANIDLSGMNSMQRTAVAIAGYLAEARAAANSEEGHPRVSVGPRLIQELGRIIGIAIENRLQRVSGIVPITALAKGVEDVPSILTLEDIELIPDDALEDDKGLPGAIDLACRLINEPTEWTTIKVIAEKLVDVQPEPIENLGPLLAGGKWLAG